MTVALGFRRGKSCIPRDRTQGLAALGFAGLLLADAWERCDPRCLDSSVTRFGRPGRAPRSGPDALADLPAEPDPEDGPQSANNGTRLVPRSPIPDSTWAAVARLIAAGYSPTEAGARLGLHRTTIWGRGRSTAASACASIGNIVRWCARRAPGCGR
ncbi:hypothetical protein [Azospirillum thermophilum]|uniref:Uncharacterized protein n=1 Tax=Azospirillum thermophilum TaxID=2202148 RepID=A0A2S2CYG3_9PROT|nr:hypothetical protein [Azospirillum thermophilum]AWK89508.1 hypothetical protein DEW08_26160 [Azospirillum thermophilum]